MLAAFCLLTASSSSSSASSSLPSSYCSFANLPAADCWLTYCLLLASWCQLAGKMLGH